MKFKNIFIIIAVLCLFIPFTSAAFDDKVVFHEDGNNGKYGYYEINDTTFWLFNNKPVKTVELLENEYSILTAWNIKEIKMFRSGKLFDKTNYLDKTQKHDKSGIISSESHYYRVFETKTRAISDGYCGSHEYSINGTEFCSEWVDNSYTEEYDDWGDWKIYDFKTVQEGLYQTKTFVTRIHKNTGEVDWVDENEGHDLDAWAVWWNDDWSYKVELNVTETSGSSFTNYSTLIYINYTEDLSSNANSDFSDLRFLNSTENGELSYWIENKTDSSFAWVWVEVPTLTASSTSIIYMYYGNSGASSSSDIFNTFIYGNDGAVDDFTDNLIGTCTASLDSGAIKSACTGWSSSGVSISSLSSGNYELHYKERLQNDGSGTHYGGLTLGDSTLANGYDNRVSLGIVHSDTNSEYWSIWDSAGQILNSPNAHNYGWVTLNSQVNISSLTTSNGADNYLINESNSLMSYSGAGYRGSMNDIGYIITSQFESTIWMDDIRFREKASSEPTYIFGDEQESIGVSTTLIHPTNGQNIINNTVNFNYTSTPTGVNLTNTTAYIWWSNGTLLYTNFTNITGLSPITTNFVLELDEGMYKWNAETCGEGVDCSLASSNNSFSIHITSPSINIIDPNGTIEFFELGTNQTLTWRVTENSTNLTEHIIECVYEYNGTIFNVTDICITTNSTSFQYALGINSLTFNVTDSFGLVSSTIQTWNYSLIEINRSFNAQAVEGSQELFELLVRTPDSINASTFVYNGLNSSMNILSLGGGDYKLSKEFKVPEVINDTNFTFYFNVSLINIGQIRTDNSNQTVLALNVANCTVYNNSVMNLSLFNELTLVPINGTIEFNLELRNSIDESLVSKITTTFADISTVEVCSNLNVTSPDYIYNLELRYFSSQDNETTYDFVPEFYHVQKASTESLPQSINLYDLNINESTEFTIFFRDNDYVARENVLLQIQRKYVNEGIFRVIEIPITSSEGSAVGHFDLNNYKYQIIATKDGEVINIFPNPSIRCESELSGICTISLKGEKPIPQAEQVTELINFAYIPTQNDTSNKISIFYTIPTGESKITNIEMTQVSPFTEPALLCNKTLLASGGQVECFADDAIGDSQVYVKIISDGILKANLVIHFQEDLSSSFALQNYFIAAILLIFLITMFVTSPQIMIIVSVLGVIYLGFMFLLKSSSVGLVLGAVSWLLVAAVIIISKLQKSEEE